MFYKCEDCGAIWENPKSKRVRIGEFWGAPVYIDETCCEACGGDLDECKTCDCCGEYFTEEEGDTLYKLCRDCVANMMTVKNSIDYGRNPDTWESVDINPFFAYLYTSEDINRIIEEYTVEHAVAKKIDAEAFWRSDEETLVNFVINKKEEK